MHGSINGIVFNSASNNSASNNFVSNNLNGILLETGQTTILSPEIGSTGNSNTGISLSFANGPVVAGNNSSVSDYGIIL